MITDAVDRARLVDRFGEHGGRWADELGDLVMRLCSTWHLDPAELLVQGGTSVAIRCARATGDDVVLKLTPDRFIAAQEAAALRNWAGTPHAVELVDEDEAHGALVLEWLDDAPPLSRAAWSIDEVVPMLVDLARPRDVAVDFPLVGERLAFVFDLWQRRTPASAVAPELFARGLARARRLASDGPAHLLHGDLHPGNVLRVRGRGCVAIDPRPCLGDRAADLVDWALADDVDGEDALHRRVDLLATAVPDVSADRLLAWCRAFAVLLVASRLRRGRDDERTAYYRSLAE